MKDCKIYRDWFIHALYDELSETDGDSFQKHLNICQNCASEFENLVETLTIMDKRKSPQLTEKFWDGYWSKIEQKVEKHVGEKKKFQFREKLELNVNFKIRWALYPVSAILLIMLGIFIGKNLFHSPSKTGTKDMNAIAEKTQRSSSNQKIGPILSEHFENIHPMLIECSNLSTSREGSAEDNKVLIDEVTLKKIILQNYLLKRMVSKTNDPTLKQLLDELELILLEISNLNGQNVQTKKYVQKLIQNNDILFKLKIYSRGTAPVKL